MTEIRANHEGSVFVIKILSKHSERGILFSGSCGTAPKWQPLTLQTCPVALG